MSTATLRAPVGVDSDVAPLERVLVHRPGPELGLVTGATASQYLFDGPIDLRSAAREHEQLTDALRGTGAEVLFAEQFLDVPPPPNLLFPRDLFAVVGPVVVQARMRRFSRRAEGALAATILEATTTAERLEASAEGGDVLVYGDGVVLLGIGERTPIEGAAALTRELLSRGIAREVIGAVLPPGGPFRLDLALTLVDRGVVLADLPVLDQTRAICWRWDDAPRHHDRLLDALPDGPRVIAAAGGSHDRAWDRGANVLAVAPARVIAYADNEVTTRRLEDAGIEVLEVPGSTLGLGRGGPRCLTAPLLRGA